MRSRVPPLAILCVSLMGLLFTAALYLWWASPFTVQTVDALTPVSTNTATAEPIIQASLSEMSTEVPQFNHLYFNGSTYVEVPDNPALSVATTGGLTIDFMMCPRVDANGNFVHTEASPDGAYVEFLGKGIYDNTNEFEYAFRIYNRTDSDRPTRVSFYIFNKEAGLGVGSYFQDDIILGECFEVTGKVDNTYTYIYKNGVLRDKDNYRQPEAPLYSINPVDTAAPFRIGTVTGESYFEGLLYNVSVFDAALTDSHIALLRTDTVLPSSLIAFYPLTYQWMTANMLPHNNFQDPVSDGRIIYVK